MWLRNYWCVDILLPATSRVITANHWATIIAYDSIPKQIMSNLKKVPHQNTVDTDWWLLTLKVDDSLTSDDHSKLTDVVGRPIISLISSRCGMKSVATNVGMSRITCTMNYWRYNRSISYKMIKMTEKLNKELSIVCFILQKATNCTTSGEFKP